MRLVCYADFHICHSWPLVPVEEFDKAHHRLAEYCEKNKPSVVLFLGDMYRARQPKGEVRVRADEAIRRLSRVQSVHGGSLGILTGNHDKASESVFAGDSFGHIRLFADVMPNVVIMDKPGTYDFETCLVHALPSGFDYKAEYFTVDPKRLNVFTYHGLVQGAVFDPSGNVKASSGLTTEQLDNPQYDVVLCGDVHTPQQFDLKHTRGGYVGSTLRLTEADSGDKRGWLQVDLEKGSPPEFWFVEGGGPEIHKVTLTATEWDKQRPETGVVIATLKGTVAQLRGVKDEAVQALFPNASTVKVRRDPVYETSALVQGIAAQTSPLDDTYAFIRSSAAGLDQDRLKRKAAEVAQSGPRETKGMYS